MTETVLKMLNILSNDSQIFKFPNIWKICLHKIIKFIATLFVMEESRKSTNGHQLMKSLFNLLYPYSGILFDNKNKCDNLCYIMAEPWKFSTEEMFPHILWFNISEICKISNSTFTEGTERRIVAQRDGLWWWCGWAEGFKIKNQLFDNLI